MGALGAEEYKKMGYLPEGLNNYLLRLGWSHGDNEIITREQAIEWFGIDGMGKSPACLDFNKMKHMNAHYLRQMDNETLAEMVVEHLVKHLVKHYLGQHFPLRNKDSHTAGGGWRYNSSCDVYVVALRMVNSINGISACASKIPIDFYSTVTTFAKFLGISGLIPRVTDNLYAIICITITDSNSP